MVLSTGAVLLPCAHHDKPLQCWHVCNLFIVPQQRWEFECIPGIRVALPTLVQNWEMPLVPSKSNLLSFAELMKLCRLYLLCDCLGSSISCQICTHRLGCCGVGWNMGIGVGFAMELDNQMHGDLNQHFG